MRVTYRMLAVDLDETLVHGGRLAASTLDLLLDLQQGWLVVPVTVRPQRLVESLLPEVLARQGVFAAGAHVVTDARTEVKRLPAPFVNAVLAELEASASADVAFETVEALWCTGRALAALGGEGPGLQLLQRPDQVEASQVLKMITDAAGGAAWKGRATAQGAEPLQKRDGRVEFLASGVGKGPGLVALQRLLPFDGLVVAVGDDDSDVSLFEEADFGFAMPGSSNALRAVASAELQSRGAGSDGLVRAVDDVLELLLLTSGLRRS